MSAFIDLTGQRFGRLLALKWGRTNAGRSAWECQCDCGTVKSVDASSLRGGLSRSCGCGVKESAVQRFTTHGGSKSQMYRLWASMIQRCTQPNDGSFARYGGRGITVCERWRDFAAFAADMGPRPSPGHSIDRIDNDGHYDPGNCRWATAHEQGLNKRTNRILELNGKRQAMSVWAKQLGMTSASLMERLDSGRWTVEQALSIPKRGKRLCPPPTTSP